MDIALIVIGILIIAAILLWAFARMGDAEEIDNEIEKEVRAESAEQHEEAKAKEAALDAAQNAEDVELYSHE